MRPETKTIYGTGTTPCDTIATISLLNGIQQGDTGDTREGRKITLKSINLRGVDYVTETTGKDQMHRIMIVQQYRPNGAFPLINDILQATTISSLRNRNKFTILKCYMIRRLHLTRQVKAVAPDLYVYIRRYFSMSFLIAELRELYQIFRRMRYCWFL